MQRRDGPRHVRPVAAPVVAISSERVEAASGCGQVGMIEVYARVEHRGPNAEPADA